LILFIGSNGLDVESVLILAVKKGLTRIVKLLLENGADINYLCNEESALIIALIIRIQC